MINKKNGVNSLSVSGTGKGRIKNIRCKQVTGSQTQRFLDLKSDSPVFIYHSKKQSIDSFDFIKLQKSDSFTQCSTLVRKLRKHKFINEEKYYRPIFLTYSKVDIPTQIFKHGPSTKSLHKVIDTPMRETGSNSSMLEEMDPSDFQNIFEEQEEESLMVTGNVLQQQKTQNSGAPIPRI